jgi:hypothetical protein
MKFTFSLIAIATVTLIISCGKSSYTTKPQITVESITSIVPFGGNLEAKIQYTQKTGDLGDGTLIAIRNRLNVNPPRGSGNSSPDSLTYSIPSFPNTKKGEIDFTLEYDYLNQGHLDNDTIVFKFAVIDAAGNKSDTITSNKIVILSQ